MVKDPLEELLIAAVGDLTEEPLTIAYQVGEYADGELADIARAVLNRIPEPQREALLLGLAWAEAEAALPEGWLGPWLQPPTGGYPWEASARNDPEDDEDIENPDGAGPTPRAALRALTAKLRERQP